MAFDYWRVRWLWIHTSTLWLDLQSYYNFSLASQEQASCQGTEKYERHRQNSHLGHTDTLSTFVYALIWTKTAYPCDPADTEQRTQFTSSGYSPKWLYADAEEINCWIKSLFGFLCAQKVFSSLCKITVEPLMSDGLFWRCLSYFSVPWQYYLLSSQWDSHKPPGFHPKYLKLCSKDEQSFYGFGTTWG